MDPNYTDPSERRASFSGFERHRLIYLRFFQSNRDSSRPQPEGAYHETDFSHCVAIVNMAFSRDGTLDIAHEIGDVSLLDCIFDNSETSARHD